MPRYDVHLYATVRVLMARVEAGSANDALMKADAAATSDLMEEIFSIRTPPLPAVRVEYADEIREALVDEIVSEEQMTSKNAHGEFIRERWFDYIGGEWREHGG